MIHFRLNVKYFLIFLFHSVWDLSTQWYFSIAMTVNYLVIHIKILHFLWVSSDWINVGAAIWNLLPHLPFGYRKCMKRKILRFFLIISSENGQECDGGGGDVCRQLCADNLVFFFCCNFRMWNWQKSHRRTHAHLFAFSKAPTQYTKILHYK